MSEWQSLERIFTEASERDTDYVAELCRQHQVDPDEVDTEQLIQLRLSKIKKRYKKPHRRRRNGK